MVLPEASVVLRSSIFFGAPSFSRRSRMAAALVGPAVSMIFRAIVPASFSTSQALGSAGNAARSIRPNSPDASLSMRVTPSLSTKAATTSACRTSGMRLKMSEPAAEFEIIRQNVIEGALMPLRRAHVFGGGRFTFLN